MKKLIFILTTILAVSSFQSCTDDFLEVTPTTLELAEFYYSNEEEITKALMAAYNVLQWPDFVFWEYGPLPFISDIMSDDVRVGGAHVNDIPVFTQMRFFRASSEFTPSVLWVVFYSGIYRTNTVINNMDKVQNISSTRKNRILAEAYTLRAYYYFWLWKLWGNVPYYDKNPEENFYVPQLSADEVYKRILSDLDFAIQDNKLPLTVPKMQKGRITQATAQMLKANLVMYQKDEALYPEVLNDMREIIQSGLYSLYPYFADIWEDIGEWCSESIFEVNYTDNPSSRTWENATRAGGTVYPTLIGINALVNSPHYAGGGYGFEPVEKSLYDLYDDADQRKDGGILNFAKYQQSYPQASYVPRYDDTGYFNRKYLPRLNGNDKFVSGPDGGADINYRNNYRVFRYAETLLIASELIVRTGGNQEEADLYLNQVRARAFQKDIDDPEFSTKKRVATLDNLLLENRLEFACEGHRFWDLVRYDKAVEVLGDRGYTPNKKHLPIPQSEIDQAKGTLIQNPY